MNCKNCIHWGKCSKTNGKTRYYGETIASDNVEELCEWFISTADVVPKSEVEELISENKSLANTVNESSVLIRKLRSKVNKSKADVAKEIFEEIENYILANCCLTDDDVDGIWKHIAKLKKKYT